MKGGAECPVRITKYLPASKLLCAVIWSRRIRERKKSFPAGSWKTFHLKGSELRRLVNILRCEGKPICSNAMGYFYAATQQELQETISQLTSRIQMISRARDGLLKSLERHTQRRAGNGE